MCGGIGFKIKNIPDKELKKYYSPAMVARFKAEGRVESFFWQRVAVLPVETEEGIQLKLWGNKDEEVKLPKTGWAREESMKNGKWDWLKQELVNIPADSGYEKKTWFDMPGGTKGIIVEKNNDERVYMITKEASREYKKETGHNREPLGKKKNYKSEPGKQKKLV